MQIKLWKVLILLWIDLIKELIVKTKSAKAKGRKLQNYVVEELKKAYSQLEEDDIKGQVMGMSGEDVVLSPLAKRTIGLSFECKNQERLNLWDSLLQAENNCEERTPVLVFKRNRSQAYAAIPFKYLIKLLSSNQKGKLMKIGNNYYGITTEKDYNSIRIFPFGLELCLFENIFQICITLGIIELNFGIKMSGLFKD